MIADFELDVEEGVRSFYMGPSGCNSLVCGGILPDSVNKELAIAANPIRIVPTVGA